MPTNQSKQNDTAIAAYLTNLHRYPQLKHPEVVELFQVYEKGGQAADAARTRLAECNLRLVVSIARRYKNHNIPIEDLIQEGNIGLMKSIERFDWKKGFRFSTYSTWWIKQSIGQHVLKRKRMIRLPAHAVAIQKKIIQASKEFKEQTGQDPTPEELSALIGASETVIKATIFSGKNVISLQQTTSSNEEASTIADHIEDESEHANPLMSLEKKQLLGIVKNVLLSLSPKEASILRLRFGLCEDETNHEKYPITESEISEMKMKGTGLK